MVFVLALVLLQVALVEARVFALGPPPASALVRRHLIEYWVGKMGGCHLLRHTVATLRLENGADIPVTQQDARLTTTDLRARVDQPGAPSLLRNPPQPPS